MKPINCGIMQKTDRLLDFELDQSTELCSVIRRATRHSARVGQRPIISHLARSHFFAFPLNISRGGKKNVYYTQPRKNYLTRDILGGTFIFRGIHSVHSVGENQCRKTLKLYFRGNFQLNLYFRVTFFLLKGIFKLLGFQGASRPSSI